MLHEVEDCKLSKGCTEGVIDMQEEGIGSDRDRAGEAECVSGLKWKIVDTDKGYRC